MQQTTVVISSKQKFAAWTLVILSYIFNYITPMVAAYFLLAEEKITEASSSKGGLAFWLVVTFAGAGAMFAVRRMVNKMKANVFKSFFKNFIKIGFIILMAFVVNYISFNLSQLLTVIWISVGGAVLGTLVEMIAVGKFKHYIREAGVF